MSENSSIIRSGKSFLIDESASRSDALDHECALFTRYVINQIPSDYVVLKYRQAHAVADFVCTAKTSHWDRFLLRLCTRHPVATRFVDTYTSFFSRNAMVRKKWILLLAILESCAPTHNCFDLADDSSNRRVFIGLLANGVLFLLTLCFSSLLLMPIQLVFAVHTKLSGRA